MSCSRTHHSDAGKAQNVKVSLRISIGDIVKSQGGFVCLVLLLYVPCQQLWSLRDGQFT